MVSTAKGHKHLPVLLLDLSKLMLDMFMPLTDGGFITNSFSYDMPNSEDVENFLNASLPAVSSIITEEIFVTAPLIPVTCDKLCLSA